MATRLEQIADIVHAHLADPTVEREIGQLAIANHTAQRCIVWVPVTSRVEPASRSGGALVAGSTEKRVDQAFMRLERVQLHIYAESATNVELLFDNVLAALHAKLRRSVEPEMGYEWVTEQVGEAGHVLWQAKIRLELTLRFPVVAAIQPLVVATTQSHVCTLELPDPPPPP